MSSKQELEAEVEHFKREAKANQILLTRARTWIADQDARTRPDVVAAKPKVKAPAKPKAQPKLKKARK